MKILGIDPSFTNCGLVILDNGVITMARCIKTTNKNNNFVRAHHIVKEVGRVAREHKVDGIVIEGLALNMKRTRSDVITDMAGLYYAIIIQVNVVNRFPVKIVTPTACKKHATSYGFANKPAMIDALPDDVYEYIFALGYKKSTGAADLADAYWLATMWDV